MPSTATANAGEVIASYVPPSDIVQEFKVQTATFDAATGNTEGGVTNLVIKSGTNRLRGTIYIAKTPGELFANDFFANANNIPLAPFSYNRYGGMAGGPVVLPGYDGRGKTFFMYGFEGIHESRPRNNGTPTVPTEKMRNGDFSELLALGPQYQIYNPFTRRAIGGGRFQQDPFPGNIIPQNLINPVARAALEYFGRPRRPAMPTALSNFQNPSLPEDIKYANNTIRVDQNLTDKQRMYGRFSWYDRNSNYNNYFNNLTTGEWFKFVSRQFALDHVYVMTPSTVLNFRYGYNWFVRGTDSNPANHDFDLTSLGFPAAYNASIPDGIRRFPRFDITGYQGTGIGGEERPNETQSFIATLNRSAGAHSIKTGMEVRQYRETDFFFANNQTGQFNFDSTWTRGPLDNCHAGAGQPRPILRLVPARHPELGSVSRVASYDEKSQEWGFFVQDDWRVGSRMTVNLGLRYEYETPMTEKDNQSVRGFDTTAVQAIEAAARARYALNPTPEVPVSSFNVRGGLTFAGVDGQPRGLYETPKTNFMPRVGLTFKLDELTVLRGGYGMFYGFLGQRRGDVFQSGFSQNTNIIPSLDNGLTFIGTLHEPVPERHPGTGRQRARHPDLPRPEHHVSSIPTRNRRARSAGRWGFSANSLVSGWPRPAMSATTAPSCRRGGTSTRRPTSTSAPVRFATRPTINYLGANIPNPFSGLLPSTAAAALQGANIARERLLRPYPEFDAVNTTTNEGGSWYHALQVTLQRRFAAGYTISGAYTYSKFTEAIEFLNAGDPEPWKGISSVDSPHRLTVNGIWEVPFGRGRRFGGDVNGLCLGVHQRLAAVRGSTPTRAGSRLASATSSSPANSTTSRCRRASRPWRGGSTPTPDSIRSRRSSSGRTSGPSRCGSRTSAPTP